MRAKLTIWFFLLSACAHGTGGDIGPEGGQSSQGGAGDGAGPAVEGSGGTSVSQGGQGGTSTGASITTNTVGPTTTTSTTTTTGGGNTCDNTGVCGGCQQCAATTVCLSQWNACNANADCLNLNDCLQGCPPGDPPCLDGCSSTYPNGVGALHAASTCVYCVGCFADCDGAAAGC